MEPARKKIPVNDWHGEVIQPGQSRDVQLAVSESYSGITVRIPLHIRRGVNPGPVVFVTAALHGDEINGTGAVRQLIQDKDLQLHAGSLVLVPVLNLLAFDRHSRYLPDRRDLNRSFPGSLRGSLAARLAKTILDEIVARCDYGIDLHTAAVRRTNYPTVRGDFSNPVIRRLAEAFGNEVILNGKGPVGSFRRAACSHGCPTIMMEGGEVWKVEPAIVETAVRGVKNVLRELGMVHGPQDKPDYQITAEKTKWIRAEGGGFLQFHIKPGDLVEKGQPLATNTNLLGHERNVLTSPFDAVVVGMTTLPAISPGEPVCHLAKLSGTPPLAELRRMRAKVEGLDNRVVKDLATNVLVVDPNDYSV